MKIFPPQMQELTQRNDLAAVIRDASIYAPGTSMNDESLLQATQEFISLVEEKKSRTS